MSDAVIIDGKAFAADLRAEVGRKAALLKERPRPRAGPLGRARGRRPREPRLRAQQGQGHRGGRHGFAGIPPVRQREPRGGAGEGRGAERRRQRARHPGAAPLARSGRFQRDHQRHRPGQGRGRLPHRQCGPAHHRAGEPGAVHAARLHADAAPLRRRAEGQAGDDRRPLQHRRQADGVAPAARALHRHRRPFAHPWTCPASAAAPISSSPPWGGPR